MKQSSGDTDIVKVSNNMMEGCFSYRYENMHAVNDGTFNDMEAYGPAWQEGPHGEESIDCADQPFCARADVGSLMNINGRDFVQLGSRLSCKNTATSMQGAMRHATASEQCIDIQCLIRHRPHAWPHWAVDKP